MGDDGDADKSPWESFTSIMADNLGVESTSIEPSQSFQEMGGTSLNMVSTVLNLQASGFPVTIQQFIASAGKMEEIFLTASPNAGGTKSSQEVGAGHHFSLKSLQPEDYLAAHTLLAKSFVTKCDLFSLYMEEQDFLLSLGAWWDQLSPHMVFSVGVVDENGKLRAVGSAADQSMLEQLSPDLVAHPHFLRINEMLDSVTLPFKQTVNPTGKSGVILHKFWFGACLENTWEENVASFLLLEQHLMETAKEKGFAFAVAENASPLTQQLAEYLGCQRHATFQMKHWTDKEKNDQPFSKCSDDTYVTVDVYHV